nr:unnamed protein product [Callosobruchus analis]
MVSLALNIQLKEKLNVIRSSKQVNKVKRNEDPDYVPGLSNGSDNARGNESSDPSYKFSQVTPPKQIHVLSDVIVVPKSVNQPDSNTLVTSYSTVQDCEENLQENSCNTQPEEIDFNPVQVFIRENILQDIINKSVQKSESKLYTKTGQLRKRKRFEEPLAERKKQKIESYRRAHEVKDPCQCKLNCTQKISHTRQRDINGQYWQLPKEQQKQFIWDSVKQFKKIGAQQKVKHHLEDFSYESYRKIVTNDLNISFANLGNGECWVCEEFEIHKKATSHEANVENCDVCKTWKIHKLKATNARKNYQEDAVKIKQEDEIFVAADLQKVIMLPRLETFKEILFTPHYTSKYKLQKLDARIYLKDMVCIHFKRGNHFFSYKTEIENEFIDSKDIFMKKYDNGTLTKPQARNICRERPEAKRTEPGAQPLPKRKREGSPTEQQELLDEKEITGQELCALLAKVGQTARNLKNLIKCPIRKPK